MYNTVIRTGCTTLTGYSCGLAGYRSGRAAKWCGGWVICPDFRGISPRVAPMSSLWTADFQEIGWSPASGHRLYYQPALKPTNSAFPMGVFMVCTPQPLRYSAAYGTAWYRLLIRPYSYQYVSIRRFVNKCDPTRAANPLASAPPKIRLPGAPMVAKYSNGSFCGSTSFVQAPEVSWTNGVEQTRSSLLSAYGK
jgi:hypothetical protein